MELGRITSNQCAIRSVVPHSCLTRRSQLTLISVVIAIPIAHRCAGRSVAGVEAIRLAESSGP
jgi:hypothetical protein